MQNIDTILTLDVYDYDLTPSTIKAIALDSNTRNRFAVQVISCDLIT